MHRRTYGILLHNDYEEQGKLWELAYALIIANTHYVQEYVIENKSYLQKHILINMYANG